MARSARARLLTAMTDAEAAVVLRQLLSLHPELLAEAYDLARAQLVAVERESVAEAVGGAILGVSLEDIWDRSGARSDGSYVEEVEAAWDVFEEALAPFSDEVVRLLEVGELDAAQATVEGALVALHELPRDPSGDAALSRAEDFPAEAAATLVDRWAAAGGRPLDDAFLQGHVPRWAAFLARRGSR